MNTEIPANLLPIIIPLIAVQLGLAIFAITRIVKQPSFKYGNKTIWILVSLFINLIGPILYFTIGKEEQQ